LGEWAVSLWWIEATAYFVPGPVKKQHSGWRERGGGEGRDIKRGGSKTEWIKYYTCV